MFLNASGPLRMFLNDSGPLRIMLRKNKVVTNR